MKSQQLRGCDDDEDFVIDAGFIVAAHPEKVTPFHGRYHLRRIETTDTVAGNEQECFAVRVEIGGDISDNDGERTK